MKNLLNIILFSFIAINSFATDNTVTNDSPAAQKELLFQHFVKEMQQRMQGVTSSVALSFTNEEAKTGLRAVFESVIVDPSFGLEWDEVPAPTMAGPDALAAVNSFVATNGWNMQTNDCIFDCITDDDNQAKSKPVGGLPWTVIHEQMFPAVTRGGVLYVYFRGFHHDGHGVAYNPQTNQFAGTIDSFKPIGQHWYVWAFDHEFPPTAPQPQIYEGTESVKVATPASK